MVVCTELVGGTTKQTTSISHGSNLVFNCSPVVCVSHAASAVSYLLLLTCSTEYVYFCVLYAHLGLRDDVCRWCCVRLD